MQAWAILRLSDKFYRAAAVQSVMKLREPRDKKYLGSNLWFGPQLAQQRSDERNFAILDRQNVNIIQEVSLETGNDYTKQEASAIYLEHNQTKQTMYQIIHSYNKYFGPRLDGWKTLEFLEQQSLDPTIQTIFEPTFALVHDLIHQVIEPKFITNLENQTIKDKEGDTIKENVVILIDEINEDLASLLSNISPEGNFTAQGLRKYIAEYLLKFLKEPITPSNLSIAIDKTFHQTRAELYGKVDALKVKRRLGKEYLQRYRSVERASAKIKQLLGGVLSKYKNHMMKLIPYIMKAVRDEDIKLHKYDVPDFIYENSKEIFNHYRDKMMEADVLDPADASALRSWLIESLGYMKKLNQYFQNTYRKEEMMGWANLDEEENEKD